MFAAVVERSYESHIRYYAVITGDAELEEVAHKSRCVRYPRKYLSAVTARAIRTTVGLCARLLFTECALKLVSKFGAGHAVSD